MQQQLLLSRRSAALLLMAVVVVHGSFAFVPATTISRYYDNNNYNALATATLRQSRRHHCSNLFARQFYDDFARDEEEDGDSNSGSVDDDDNADNDDDDEYIDSTTLGDWRAFRHGLQTKTSTTSTTTSTASVCAENKALLQQQNPQLVSEYLYKAWAHEISQPEVGSLVLRMPLEVEIFRNYRRSIVGQSLRRLHGTYFSTRPNMDLASTWYTKAHELVQQYMIDISTSNNNNNNNGNSGQNQQHIDIHKLSHEKREMLQLYLDHQESWQQVCLVLERDPVVGTATTLVLNRPMAQKLTPSIGQLVLNGAYVTTSILQPSHGVDFDKFMQAFADECAIYVGGPDDQEEPATLIHGIADLDGAVEIEPGTNIYTGGLAAAVQGVLAKKYRPSEFRFFIGKHYYEDFSLDISVVLGKNQPVAAARVFALKQCLSLPKPLWHEVMEYCGGDLAKISKLELEKRHDLSFEVLDAVDDDDSDDDDGDEYGFEDGDNDDDDETMGTYFIDIPNELDELYRLDDDDDDYA